MKLETHVQNKLEEIREELPNDNYLYLFNAASSEVEEELRISLDEILKHIAIILEIQGDCHKEELYD